MSDESQNDLSNEGNEPSAEDVKAAWEKGEELPQTEEQIEEGVEETPPASEDSLQEEEGTKISASEPIVLRKQKARLKAERDAARAELAQLRGQSATAVLPLPSLPIDPSTGQPVDENSVQGQVYKTLADIAEQHKKAEETRQHATRQSMIQQQYQELQDKLDMAVEKYADFDDVVLANDVPITNAMRDAALMLSNPDDVLYAIAKNRTELNRIGKLPPLEQAREMVAKSAELLSKRTTVKASGAPRPLSKVSHNPAARTPSREINENSSVSEIRARLKKTLR